MDSTAHLPPPLMIRPASTVLETRAAVASGALSVDAALAACRANIELLDPALRAFTVVNDAAPENVDPKRPLAGIAIGIKDLYDTAGIVTAYGSAIHSGNIPDRDAALVTRLRALGGHVAGKTVTTEFAWRQAGPTVNPWNDGHTPGGSSSGSAAAVAAGLVPLAIGTQTFGSVIRPAAFCGIVGFKPSRAVLPLEGAHPLSPTLDHAGLFARTLDDIAYTFSALVPPSGSVFTRGAPRIRLVRGSYWDQASKEQQAVIEQAASHFESKGAVVEALELPTAFDDGLAIAEVILCHEAAVIFGAVADRHPDLLSAHMKDLVTRGRALPAAANQEALAARKALQAMYAEEMRGWDSVLTLPALGEAPPLREGTGNAAPCVLWTLLGVPTVTLPRSKGAQNLPLGLQLVGHACGDHSLLAASGWCATA